MAGKENVKRTNVPMKTGSYFIVSQDDIEKGHITQVGVSACGATAALNVLACFGINIATEKAVNAVKTNLRKHVALLPEYLLSRSCAGTTHGEIIEGMHQMTQGFVKGRFFPFFPKRKINLQNWLAEWFQRGAIPVATFNLQKEKLAPGHRIADAWHHQMVYGVSEQGVDLCNPIGIMPFDTAMDILCSESVLKIRMEDVLLRYREELDWGFLSNNKDNRWREMKVAENAEKLYEIYRESKNDERRLITLLSSEYLEIPAAYHSGVSLFIKSDSKYCDELLNANELPLENESKSTST